MNSIFEVPKFTIIKLIVILPMRTNELIKLFRKAARSPLIFAKYVIYKAIKP